MKKHFKVTASKNANKKSIKASNSNKRGMKNMRNINASTDYSSLKSDYRYDSYDKLAPEDCLDRFVDGWVDSNSYIADAIFECADDMVDIYNQDLCESCWDLYSSGAYEETVSNGLIEGVTDLMQVLQACQGEFYSGVLYENLDAVMRNLVLNYLDSESIDVSDDMWESVCDELLTGVDNNDRISDVCERVADYIRDNSDVEENEDYDEEE